MLSGFGSLLASPKPGVILNNQKKRIPRGTRAGSAVRNAELRDVHSRIRGNSAHNLHGTSATAVLQDAAKYYECSFVEENRADHIVPRQSITRQQLLGIFPQRVETEPAATRQLDKQTGELVETTDNRVRWKSDKTLLRRGNPFSLPTDFKRQGSIGVGLNTRKTLTPMPEVPMDEKILGPALDGTGL